MECCHALDLMVTDYNPIAAGTYLDLPEELQMKMSLLNIKNADHKLVLSH